MVAIKVMSPAAVKSPEAVKRFHREVQAAARLTHPNIVIAFDADESNGTHFLVMEYVDGIDLSALVKKRGPLPVELASNCVLQAARGLQFAHEQGVIHRDIKPSNLLIDQKGTVKILDMGLARIEGAVGGSSEGASLTNTGTIMGTVDYMSPEQAMDTKHADARSDIYSLGCSLYYLLTGKAVYDGDTMMKKLMAHQNAPIPTLVAEAASAMAESGVFGHAFDPLFRRMVAKLPEDRPQSMLEVITDLKACRSAGTSVIESFERSGDSYLADLAEQSGPVTRSDPWANTKSDAHSGHDATLISSLDKPRTIRLPVASHRGRLILAATIIFGLIGVVAAIQQVPWHDRNKKDVVADSHLGANSPAEHAADSQTAVPSGWHGWSKEAPAHAATPFNAEQAKRHQRASVESRRIRAGAPTVTTTA